MGKKKDAKDAKKDKQLKKVADEAARKARKKAKKGASKGADEAVVAAAISDNVVPAPLGGFTEALRVDRTFQLLSRGTDEVINFDGDKAAGETALAAYTPELADLLERLFAESKAGGKRSILLVIQGMDTSGKGGIMRHVVSVDPLSVDATSFTAPTKEELAHHFLWRIEKALPHPGELMLFDRSHYEDVLIVRVHDLVPEAVWSKRYAEINAWERKVIASGTTIIKVMMHLGRDEQKERLMERLSRPDKFWKYNPGDVDERARWADYQTAYQAVIAKTSTVGAPWHVVPADRKWYARLAVQQLLLEALRGMDLTWPSADFDVEAEKARLAES